MCGGGGQKRAIREQNRILQEQEERRIAEARAAAEEARQSEERRAGNIALGESEIAQMFGQFNDDFYNQRQQSYLQAATPQLDQQYQDQLRALTANLARAGQLNSSTRGEMMAKLQREYEQQKMGLANNAMGFGQQTRAAVEAAQERLRQSNRQLADPGAIRNSAQAEVSGLMANPQFASLGNLLSNLAADVTQGNTTVSNKVAAGSGVQLFDPAAGGGTSGTVSGSARLVG
jgi:hypothetical protein